MTRVQRARSHNRPSYSQTVRNGLLLIAKLHTPDTDEERRAIAWIRAMNSWHVRVVQPYERAYREVRKARRARRGAA